jgi:hypothetical protein
LSISHGSLLAPDGAIRIGQLWRSCASSRRALKLARQIRNQYTIAYSPLNQALDGSYRTIRLTVTGSDRLVVHTRPGYRATLQD